MLNRDKLTQEAANYKKDARKHFDQALSALLALAWAWRLRISGEFSFQANPELYAQALAICRGMSDGCAEDARKRAESIVADTDMEEEFQQAWEDTEENDYGDTLISRFDMAGSHLLQLLELWIIIAFANNYTKEYTRISILRYLGNPAASGLFGRLNKDILKWGRGYDRNLIDQLTLIGQGAIIDASRRAEWLTAVRNGMTYYIRRRGSNYDCAECDSMAGVPIPISIPFEKLHARCMCYPEYRYE